MKQDNHSKLRRRFRRYWSETERKTDRYKELRKEYEIEILVEEVKKMQLWCAERRKRFSLRRFNNWMKNYKNWEKEVPEDLDEQERKRTKEYLKQYADENTQH